MLYFTWAIFDSTLYPEGHKSAASQPDRSPHDDLSGSIDLTVSKRENEQKLTVRSIYQSLLCGSLRLLCETLRNYCDAEIRRVNAENRRAKFFDTVP